VEVQLGRRAGKKEIDKGCAVRRSPLSAQVSGCITGYKPGISRGNPEIAHWLNGLEKSLSSFRRVNKIRDD
jgi:hypothetical protein